MGRSLIRSDYAIFTPDSNSQRNAIIKNVLNPDVQIFDSSGNYHPNPANTARDSLYLAIGFTAVPAR